MVTAEGSGLKTNLDPSSLDDSSRFVLMDRRGDFTKYHRKDENSMREVAAVKQMKEEASLYMATATQIATLVSSQANLARSTIGGKDITNHLYPRIISRPLNVDKKLRVDHMADPSRGTKVGKLVDQFRILCKQPTDAEMSKKGAPKFRRPVPPKPPTIDGFTKRTNLARAHGRRR